MRKERIQKRSALAGWGCVLGGLEEIIHLKASVSILNLNTAIGFYLLVVEGWQKEACNHTQFVIARENSLWN